MTLTAKTFFSVADDVAHTLLESIIGKSLFPRDQAAFNHDAICASVCGASAVDDAVAQSLKLLEQRLTKSLHDILPESLPTRKLPEAVILQIIEDVLNQVECTDRTVRLLQLSSVSTSWRSAALNSPHLWTTILSSDHARLIDLSLARSKELPLVISFDNAWSRGLEEASFVDKIRPYQHRWKQGCFKGISSKSGVLSNCSDTQDHSELKILVLLGQAEVNDSDPTFEIAVRATHLMAFKLHGMRINVVQLLQTIAASSQLVLLELNGLVSDSSNPPDLESPSFPVELPRLKSLPLKSLQSGILMPLFQYTRTTPDLADIKVHHDLSSTETDLGANTGTKAFSDWVSGLTWESYGVVMVLDGYTITLNQPDPNSKYRYSIELRGDHVKLLPWLRNQCLEGLTDEDSIHLDFTAQFDEYENNDVLESLMGIPQVTSLRLRKDRDVRKWIWLLTHKDPMPEGTFHSWIWPKLTKITLHGRYVKDVMVLGMTMARYKLQEETEAETRLRVLELLRVEEGAKNWSSRVVELIRETIGSDVLQLE